MKKLILLSFVFLTVISCGDEVKFSSPAFQGSYNNQLWRAKAFSASIDETGALTITGTNNVETLELILPTATVGDYYLGDVESMEARFTGADGTVYSTNNPNGTPYPDYGEIRLTEILNNTFTGTFRFNAYSASGAVANFTGNTGEFDDSGDPIYGGIFFKVPLLSGVIPANPIVCDDVVLLADDALVAYEATYSDSLEFIDQANFETACNNYIAALITQKNYCGDVDGAIQDLIDDLNACVFPCEYAVSNAAEAESQWVTATIGNYIEKCTQYLFYLQEQIAICEDEDGSIQLKIDELDCGDDDSDGIPNVFENFNGDVDGNLEDDDTDMDGIPNYLDNDDDGDGVWTLYEAKDENGDPIDTDGDLDVDFLDNDDDGDGILTIYENADPNGDGNPDDAIDTDGDGVPDYLDNDDDGDGILTIDENPDANGDGNPDDAMDSDGNGVPDYLQA